MSTPECVIKLHLKRIYILNDNKIFQHSSVLIEINWLSNLLGRFFWKFILIKPCTISEHDVIVICLTDILILSCKQLV